MAHERKILEKFPFLENNTRWAGQAEVIHRTTTYEDGNSREFIDLSLKVGERFLNLPIRELDEVIKALQEARKFAGEKLQVLLAEQRNEPRNNDSRRGGRGRDDRRGGNRED